VRNAGHAPDEHPFIPHALPLSHQCAWDHADGPQFCKILRTQSNGPNRFPSAKSVFAHGQISAEGVAVAVS